MQSLIDHVSMLGSAQRDLRTRSHAMIYFLFSYTMVLTWTCMIGNTFQLTIHILQDTSCVVEKPIHPCVLSPFPSPSNR
jgi:hypothetical protein